MSELGVEQLLQAGMEHHRAGRLREAEQIYRQILAREPRHAGALHLLGMIAGQVGQAETAIELIRRAIALRPGEAAYYSNLARFLTDAGQFDAAIAACGQALALKPDFADARLNLAVAHNNFGNMLLGQKRMEEASAAFERAIQAKPDYAPAHNNLGAALNLRHQPVEAMACFRRAIELQPGLADAHNGLANAFNAKGMIEEASAAVERALALNPNFAIAHSNLGHIRKNQGLPEEAVASCRRALELDPQNAVFHSNLLFTLQYLPASTRESLREEAREWWRRHGAALAAEIRPHANDRDPARRLRVGYVSPDFRAHAVGQFMLTLLAAHDRAQVEVFAYSNAVVTDAMTDRLRAECDQWHEIAGISDERACELIRGHGIDILVDLAMHTANNRALVFARKPAPVQVAYLAYPGTTGMTTIDYRLTDRHLDPEDSVPSAEKAVRLPETYWCYGANPAAPPVTPPPHERNGHITFGSLNNFSKVSPGAVETWGRILEALPGSRLVLHAHEGAHRERIGSALAGRGIKAERCAFVAYRAPADYLAEYGEVDIALDPLPYAGGTTTCDALWMGVPVITLAGKTAIGRGGVSILSSLGMTEWIAESPEEYVRLAVGLAQDPGKLTELRGSLRERMQSSPVMDGSRFARHVEAAFRRMWETWCAGGLAQ